MLYLDHAAATPLRAEARGAMEPYLDADFGNPSGIHGVSRRAKDAVEAAREQVADLLGAEHPLDVVFTGGGTESVNLGVWGPLLAAGPGHRLVTSAIEHEAVLAGIGPMRRLGFEATVVGVDWPGVVEPSEVATGVDSRTVVVSVMAANNETGVVQPVAKIAEAVRSVRENVLLHTDAVQAVVGVQADLASLGVDMLSLSGHKIGGPKGVGVLIAPRRVTLGPIIHGGGQELGRRSGTHHVAGIVGLAAALAAAVADAAEFRRRIGAERDRFEHALSGRVPDAEVTGVGAERLIQHSHVRFPGVPAETLLIRLDASGVAASSGSACQSGATKPSHVLTALGMSEPAARQCVRFTFGHTTADGDGGRAAAVVAEAVEALR
ncbi:MAG: cysteine desulfurase family protein [Acidimicrobiia bacterium]